MLSPSTEQRRFGLRDEVERDISPEIRFARPGISNPAILVDWNEEDVPGMMAGEERGERSPACSRLLRLIRFKSREGVMAGETSGVKLNSSSFWRICWKLVGFWKGEANVLLKEREEKGKIEFKRGAVVEAST